MENLTFLFRELIDLPKETEWVEFKHNNKDAQEIGEYISAIANTTALSSKDHGYVVWGVENETHQIVGTSFKPNQEKKGNEDLVGWLFSLLHPKVDFHFMELEINHLPIVILEISPAYSQPVQFAGIDYIRMGSYKVNLKNHPEKERALWKLFDHSKFEEGIAAESIGEEELLKLLDYPLVFDMMKRPFPSTKEEILHSLTDLNFIKLTSGNKWSITNLGAILFAKDLNHFRYLKRKILRIILYKGSNRMETIKEQMVVQGYASGFDRYITTIYNLIPSHEVIDHGIRKTAGSYPEIAIRELVANTLIHQDFSMTGCGPMVEIFADRIEMTNPGRPLVDTNRFVDTTPKSRNENLAAIMRLTGICEERGSGIDKVVMQTEINQLPAPLFEVPGDGTRSVLFAYRPLTKMDKVDKDRSCYLHACLRYMNRDFLTNSSIRERFGIETQNISTASRLIKDAVLAKMIVPVDSKAPPKLMKYVPWWVSPTKNE